MVKHSIMVSLGSAALTVALLSVSVYPRDTVAADGDKRNLKAQVDETAVQSKLGAPDLLKQSAEKIDCMIEPFTEVEVASSTSGVVREVYVDRGSIVQEDEVLAELESGVEKADAQHAEAKFEYLEKKFQRLKTLYEQNVIAYNDLEEAQTELELARHENQRAAELLYRRTIRSPFTGVVVDKYISPGELTDQQKVVKIAQLNPLKVEIIAPMSIYGSVSPGMLADIWPEGPVSGPFEAEIDIVDKVIDAASGTFGISLLLANPHYKIPAGVRCSAKFLPGDKRSTKLADQVRRDKAKKKKAAVGHGATAMMASAQVKIQQTPKGINGQAVIKGTSNVNSDTGMALMSPNADALAPDLQLTSTAQQNAAKPKWPTAAELQDIVSQFISAYEGGNIGKFDTLFSVNAKSNDHNNLAGIKQDYQDLFKNSADRHLFIDALKWSFEENQAKGVGELHALIVSKDEHVRVIKGKIQLVTEKANNKVLITHLYHYDVTVN